MSKALRAVTEEYIDRLDPERVARGEPLYITESGEVWPTPLPKEVEFEEILNDGIIPGEYEPTKFSNPFLNEHAAAILEAHAAECCEPIFWLNSKELKFKPVNRPMVTRQIYGIGDSPNERKD